MLAERRNGQALYEWKLPGHQRRRVWRPRGGGACHRAASTALPCTFHDDLHRTAAALLAGAREHDTARTDVTSTELLPS